MKEVFDGLVTPDQAIEDIELDKYEKEIYSHLALIQDKDSNYIYIDQVNTLIPNLQETGFLTFTINHKDLSDSIRDSIEKDYYGFIEATKKVVKFFLWMYNSDYVEEIQKEYDIESFQDFVRCVPYLSVRIKNYNYDLDIQDTNYTIPIRASKSSKLNKLNSYRGIVISTITPTSDIVKTEMKCSNCGAQHVISFYELDGIGSSGKCKTCEEGYYKMGETEVNDVQYLLLQDLNDAASFESSAPVTLKCIVNQELVNKVEIGDSVIVTGLMRLDVDNKDSKNLWRDKTKSNVDYYRNMQAFSPKVGGLPFPRILEVNYIEVNNSEDYSNYASSMDEINKLIKRPDLYELLIKSFCPEIKGLENIKEGALLTMIGGVGRWNTKGKIKKRGNLRMMIIADPSVAKSVIMKYCASLLKRGIYVSATSSSKVGLTGAAIKDELTGQFQIAAGAILRANGSILTIDEISKLTPEAQDALYEVGEQETFTMAKANILRTFNVDVVLIVGGNPREGRYNPDLSVYENLSDNQVPFLTRFDLKYIMRDVPNSDKDRAIAQWIMDQYNDDFEKHMQGLIPFELLAKYISYVKHFGTHPKMNKSAMDIFKEFYDDIRQKSNGNMQMVAREFEGVLRIAQARARAVWSEVIDAEIALYSIKLHKSMLIDIVPGDDDASKPDLNKMYGNSIQQREKKDIVMEKLQELVKEQGSKRIDRKVLTLVLQEYMPENKINALLQSLDNEGKIISDQFNVTLI